jgi:Na+/proline symporter
MILLGIITTQASAVTFLSAPGQAFSDGMRFVQYYFGLPLAMIVLSISFIPLFNKLKLFTAYEFLEQRFDLKTRAFTSALFLLSRGLSTGISIYAPSIVLSSLLGWNIYLTNFIMGGVVIIYTMTGGAQAIVFTQRLQFAIILGAMILVGVIAVEKLPTGIGATEALYIGGAAGKMNIITSGLSKNGFDWNDKYNILSGLIGGFFLALSYFGTDQSQVGRYLTAKDTTESRMGLLLNGIVKVPMQFLILLMGIFIFSFYQLNKSPVFFNTAALTPKIYQGKYGDSIRTMEHQFEMLNKQQQTVATRFSDALKKQDEAEKKLYKDSIRQLNTNADALRKNYKQLLNKADKSIDTNDTNYVFIRFLLDNFPVGLIGLVIAVMFLAGWGSIAAAINSLASATMIDFYYRFKKKNNPAQQQPENAALQYRQSIWAVAAWGVFCIFVAGIASKMGSLIEAVNVLGSLFYGVMLGIFLVAFYMKKLTGDAVFRAAVISEILVIVLFYLDKKEIIGIGFLWLNAIGAIAVMLTGWVFQRILDAGKSK